MDRQLAIHIGSYATYKDLVKTLQNAEVNIKNWTDRSEVNRTFTKGHSFNTLVNSLKHAVCNSTGELTDIKLREYILWEFGEFYPDIGDTIEKWKISSYHEDPKPVDWSKLTKDPPETKRIR